MTTGTERTLSEPHWRDKRCIACGGEMPLPTWRGQPYICCSGLDCGCGGGTLPIEFCSVACWEDYEPEAETDDGYEGGCQNCGRLIDKSAKGYDDVVSAPYATGSGDLYCIPCGREQDRAQREADEAEGFGDYDPYDDREPPEPDGEAYRGTEAASALAEEQARIQRELK